MLWRRGANKGMRVRKIYISTVELELDISGATLLTIEEAEQLPKRLKVYKNWWWLRSRGNNSCLVTIIDYDGFIDFHGDYITSDNDVRPLLMISNLESSNLQIGDTFKFGGKKFEIISNDKAFCLDDIGTCSFKSDWETLDANDYEKSDVKQFIDKWFKESINEEASKES